MRLVIVARGHWEIFNALRTVFGSQAPEVRLLWDRRGTDRRHAARAAFPDRRASDRRGPLPESWHDMHCVMVTEATPEEPPAA
jgi:hypothetical protein